MAIEIIDAELLQKAFIAGANNLDRNKEYINELNVFPVPDGDTGSNMSLTIMSAANEVSSLSNPTIKDLSKTISSGSLRGARGNSGVILSQLLRGFCKEIRDKSEINVHIIADGFVRAVETAYKAVMKPKEGTILTVAKGMAEKAVELAEQDIDIEAFTEAIIECGDETLQRTPDLLPVLKEAGVVDSGGQGLMEFIKGVYNGLTGKEVVDIAKPVKASGAASTEVDTENIDTSDIKFGYCTEFIINLEKEFTIDDEVKFKEYLLSIGDSLVCVADDEIVKIHVHTNHPGLAFEKGLEYGSLTRMKIDNMREEHQEKLIKEQDKINAKKRDEELAELKKNQEKKPYGFVAVSVGEGLDNIFKELGVDHIISGGQTMNPSTDDVLSAIEKVNADTVFVLPNNKNIILAANQAASIEKEKKVIVIPSKTIPQGISALIGFEGSQSPEENTESMTDGLSAVKSGEVTYAVRDTSIDGKEIKTGDFMGISDDGIKAVGTDIYEVIKELVAEMSDDDSQLISIYYGQDVSKEDADKVSKVLAESYPDYEIEVNAGNQPVYYYILSVE
ncbi:MAG: DAK2 domain-containing protein [Lachnospiraceae bacterium]|nr:DAK2 domain-containing protein [Lachnospiraceae bacterium]